jgi:hypothetical protein
MKSVKANLIKCLLLAALGITALAVSKVWANPLFFIQITNTAGLAFGSFAAGTGGTVTVSPAGVRTKTGGVVLVSSGAGSSSRFNVRGFTFPTNHTHTYSITLPANGTVTITSGGNSMAVNNFVSTPPAGVSTGTLAVGTQTQTLNVGATLTVGSGQAPGNYSGTFTVTVVFP